MIRVSQLLQGALEADLAEEFSLREQIRIRRVLISSVASVLHPPRPHVLLCVGLAEASHCDSIDVFLQFLGQVHFTFEGADIVHGGLTVIAAEASRSSGSGCTTANS